ncbi:sirohydrochlorin chelatase [Rubripirellula reticaptiva]|uniref:Sirohydrochlorin cobaltochelatase n=1 Tax=Rubripirellula reticaptiva TaxID=2528013 RepID=A0A5C6FDE4_9BACT|nr:sirohydrochlorin chelatase [Rubripirellula reticaptiva]TWU57611.1 Sirohydrochlorin cobaltochelatase [Rubripirellula reticaptiva]
MSEFRSTGVLLIGHGTREAKGTEQFFQLGRRLENRLRPVPVEVSLLEFQKPTIAEAWDALMARKVNHVHVAPLLLFAAGHAKQDIPSAIAECQSRWPGVTTDQARPLSRHPSIVKLVTDRLQRALRQVAEPPKRTAVVMVGRGSHDPCAAADMRVMTEVIRRRVNVAHVATAFYAMALPRVPDLIDKVAITGGFDAIVVHPHLLFEGRLYQAISRQIAEAKLRHPAIQFYLSDYLGPEIEVCEAIAARCDCTATDASLSGHIND